MRLMFMILVLLCFLVGCGGNPHPSDQTLEDQLRANETQFNELLNMFNEDSEVVRISKQFAFLESGGDPKLPQERLKRYRELFRVLNLEAGVYREGKNTVGFIASDNKSIFSGYSSKVYIYSTIELSPLVDSLDEVIKTKPGKHPPVFKKLYGNWYLGYESW